MTGCMKSDILKKLFLFLVFIPIISVAQDSLKQSHFVFNGYIKDMQSFIFQDIKGDWTGANLIHNRLNFKWLVSSSLTASVEVLSLIHISYPTRLCMIS